MLFARPGGGPLILDYIEMPLRSPVGHEIAFVQLVTTSQQAAHDEIQITIMRHRLVVVADGCIENTGAVIIVDPRHYRVLHLSVPLLLTPQYQRLGGIKDSFTLL